MRATTTEAHSVGNHGTDLKFFVTPNGSAVGSLGMQLYEDGGLAWGGGAKIASSDDAGGGGLTSFATILTPANYGGSSTVASTGSVTLTETGYYRFDAYIRLYASVPFRFRLRYTGSASGYMFKGSNADSDGQMSQSAIEGTGYMTYTNQGASRGLWLSGYVDITALNLGAQLHLELGATSTTGNVTTYTGSWMHITKVADT
jgi:hypothetical protein